MKELSYHQQWYQKNKERVKEYKRKYAIKNKKKIKEHNQNFYLQHREKIKARALKYYHSHRSKVRSTDMERRHKGGISKEYLFMSGLSQTPEYRRMRNKCRRKRMKKAGYLKISDIRKVYDDNIIENFGVLQCIYCHRELTMKEATLEHKQPLSRGGTNAKENLAIACKKCNYSKNNKTEEEFRGYLKNAVGEVYYGQIIFVVAGERKGTLSSGGSAKRE